MKMLNFPLGWVAFVGSMLLVSGLPAASAEPESAAPEQPANSSNAPAPKLPYAVEDVLKLTRAQISDDTVINFIQNSGTVYSLSPADIVYLSNEGVSDRVVNAMLDQRKKTAESQSQATATARPSAAAPAPGPDSVPAPVYVQPAPSQPAPSTLYVIPYPAASAAYYGSYPPYYYGSYGG